MKKERKRVNEEMKTQSHATKKLLWQEKWRELRKYKDNNEEMEEQRKEGMKDQIHE